VSITSWQWMANHLNRREHRVPQLRGEFCEPNAADFLQSNLQAKLQSNLSSVLQSILHFNLSYEKAVSLPSADVWK